MNSRDATYPLAVCLGVFELAFSVGAGLRYGSAWAGRHLS